jgi:hypothetical protein
LRFVSSERASVVLIAVLSLLSLGACTDDGGSPAPACVEIDYADCAQLYPPTWEQVWQQTLSSSCSGGGAACHAGDLRLSLVDQTTAFLELTGGAHPQVIPGDPACSPLMIRLESDDPNLRMPPGSTPLAAGARCSIATWISNGATQD